MGSEILSCPFLPIDHNERAAHRASWKLFLHGLDGSEDRFPRCRNIIHEKNFLTDADMTIDPLPRTMFLRAFAHEESVDRIRLMMTCDRNRRNERNRSKLKASNTFKCIALHIFDDDFANQRGTFR